MKKRWLLGVVLLGLAINSQSLLANEQRKGLPQMILAQTPATTQPTQTPTISPTSQATPNRSIRPPSPSDTMNDLMMIIFLVYGFVFLGLKIFEVFINQKNYNKMANSSNNTTIEILINLIEKINSIPSSFEKLAEEIKKSTEVNNRLLGDKLNEQSSQASTEVITQQLSKELNPIITTIVQEKLEEKLEQLITEQLNPNSVFINTLAEVIAEKVSSSLPSLSPKTDIESDDNLSGNPDTSSSSTDTQDDNEGIEGVDTTSDKTDENEDLTDEEKDIVDKYNRKNDELKKTRKVLPVATNKDAVYGKMIGTNHLAVFTQESSDRVYWIIEGDNNFFYLVPNLDRVKTFNAQMIGSMEAIFTINNFEKDVTDAKKFTLVKPAKVSVTKAGEEWTLVENGKGVLDFK